ncbi:MAG TPA: DinB family protein [Tepidiformaceae bacterium]
MEALPTTTEVLSRIRERRAELDALVSALDPASMTHPGPDGWTPADHLAHVAAWEQSLVALLAGTPRHAALGVSVETYDAGPDAVNIEVHRLHAGRTLDEVMSFYRRAHEEVIAAVARLSDSDLTRTYSSFQPDEPGDDSGAPIVGWILGNTADHYDEHIEWIRRLTGKEAT